MATVRIPCRRPVSGAATRRIDRRRHRALPPVVYPACTPDHGGRREAGDGPRDPSHFHDIARQERYRTRWPRRWLAAWVPNFRGALPPDLFVQLQVEATTAGCLPGAPPGASSPNCCARRSSTTSIPPAKNATPSCARTVEIVLDVRVGTLCPHLVACCLSVTQAAAAFTALP